MEIHSAITAITTLFFVACWGFDLHSRTIPNLLTGGALCAGLLLNFLLQSQGGFAWAAVGAVLTGGFLVPPWALGGVGGGDVKMMAAFGALVGPEAGLYGLAAGLGVGGLFAVVHLARIGRLGEKLAATASMVGRAVAQRTADPLRLSAQAPDAVTLPYSLPLGIGSLCVLLLLRTPQV